MTAPLRVLVSDDDPDFRLLMRLALDGHPAFTVVAEAVSREGVSARLAEVREGLTLLADYL